MSAYTVVIASEAEAELAGARDRYRAISPALETRFKDDIEAVVEAIRLNPFRFPVVYKSLRRALVRRFPYFVLFTVFGETVIVFGFVHVRRDPEAWRSRG